MAKREARLVRKLRAPLHLLLTPLAAEVIRLGQVQEQMLQLLEHREQKPLVVEVPLTAAQAERQHREVTSLLLELLQATQPNPVEQLAEMVGLPMPPPSSPSSVS
jgi:hypothetical protein